MKKQLFLLALLVMLGTTACNTLHSVTTIEPQNSFVLGNNEHNKFSVQLTNQGNNPLEIWRTPISGGKHSYLKVLPNEKVSIKVEKNTALRIENNSNNTTNVKLKVNGDLGLSMGYQK